MCNWLLDTQSFVDIHIFDYKDNNIKQSINCSHSKSLMLTLWTAFGSTLVCIRKLMHTNQKTTSFNTLTRFQIEKLLLYVCQTNNNSKVNLQAFLNFQLLQDTNAHVIWCHYYFYRIMNYPIITVIWEITVFITYYYLLLQTSDLPTLIYLAHHWF